MIAAIKHVLAASREQGHCYLTETQINAQVKTLIEIALDDRLPVLLEQMQQEDQLRIRNLMIEGAECRCYYSKSLYYDETTVAQKLRKRTALMISDQERIKNWIKHYCQSHAITLSDEQADAARGVVSCPFPY